MEPRICWPGEWPERESGERETIRIAAFNTLRRQYAFRTHPWVSEEDREWEHRLGKVLEVLASVDGDIVALEEAEFGYFDDDYVPFLEEAGYGYVQAAAKSKKDKMVHGHTKPALLFANDRFHPPEWVIARSRVVACLLRERDTGRAIIPVAVHLYGGGSDHAKNERVLQLKSVFSKINVKLAAAAQQKQKAAAAAAASSSPSEASSPAKEESAAVVVMGDFNANVDEDVFAYLWDKAPEEEGRWEPHNLGLCGDLTGWAGSEIEFFGGSRPPTFKWGTSPDDEECPATLESIDNICTTSHLVPHVYRMPFEEDEWRGVVEGGVGIPNAAHPSDHFPLAAVYRWQ